MWLRKYRREYFPTSVRRPITFLTPESDKDCFKKKEERKTIDQDLSQTQMQRFATKYEPTESSIMTQNITHHNQVRFILGIQNWFSILKSI